MWGHLPGATFCRQGVVTVEIRILEIGFLAESSARFLKALVKYRNWGQKVALDFYKRISKTARCVSNSHMIVHFYSRASFVSPHAPPKRSQMAPRTVLAPGYTGWCLACPEAAVASTGGRSRTPLRGSRRARHTAHSTPSPSHRLSRVTMALPELPASSCAESVDSTS